MIGTSSEHYGDILPEVLRDIVKLSVLKGLFEVSILELALFLAVYGKMLVVLLKASRLKKLSFKSG